MKTKENKRKQKADKFNKKRTIISHKHLAQAKSDA